MDDDKDLQSDLRDKEEREFLDGQESIDEGVADFEDGALDSSDIEKSPDLDKESVEGCPTCGNEDIQSAELLEAWKEIEQLKIQMIHSKSIVGRQTITIPSGANIGMPEYVDWKDRYEQIKKAYVKARLEVSGSFGNWDYNTRKRVLENEISSELGFKV